MSANSWVDPKQKFWKPFDQATAADLNIYQRNLFDASVHRLAYKTQDQSLTSNTTLQDDNELQVDLNEFHSPLLRVYLLWTDASGGTADLKVSYRLTAASAAFFDADGSGLNAAGAYDHQIWNFSTTINTYGTTAASTTMLTVIEGRHLGNVPDGCLWILTWAQNTSNGSAVTVKKGSMILGTRTF